MKSIPVQTLQPQLMQLGEIMQWSRSTYSMIVRPATTQRSNKYICFSVNLFTADLNRFNYCRFGNAISQQAVFASAYFMVR